MNSNLSDFVHKLKQCFFYIARDVESLMSLDKLFQTIVS